MGTVKLPSKAHAAVLVDYELLIKRPHIAKWILDTQDRSEDVQWVALLPKGMTLSDDHQFDVVITNSGGLPFDSFFKHAVDAVKDFSNLIPVVALAEEGERASWFLRHSGVVTVINNSDNGIGE